MEFYHNGDYCGEYEVDYKNPTEALERYNGMKEKFGYDIMWGNTHYNIKHIQYADNETKLVAKMTRT